jgi:hypothetical protein
MLVSMPKPPAGAQVAARVDVVGVQALAGQPHVLGLLIDKLAALRIELLPDFLTAEHVHGEAFAVVSLAICEQPRPPSWELGAYH